MRDRLAAVGSAIWKSLTKRDPEALAQLAEEERYQGFMDGSRPDCPEPSANRSASYRHGFACARADRANKPAFGGAAAALEAARLAEEEDASR